jgi:hypothetical protein
MSGQLASTVAVVGSTKVRNSRAGVKTVNATALRLSAAFGPSVHSRPTT